MFHFIFTISINALKEQINRAYEKDNCDDEKAEHLSEVNSTFECLLTMKGGEVLAEEILVADTSFLVCENILTFSGRGGRFEGSTSEPIFKAGD